MEVIYAALAGLILGAVFSLMNLPIPAPITLAGVMGVVGVWAGYSIIARIIGAA